MSAHEEAHQPATVEFKGARGTFQVHGDGSVEFVPTTRGYGCLGCARGPVSLLGNDVIGASVIGEENAFLVYHCPKGPKRKRKLRKIGPFRCPDPETTADVVLQIRQCSRSRDVLQPYGKTMLAVINPMAGNGRGQDLFMHLQTMLHAAGIACDGLVSTHAGHVVNAVASQDLDPYACIIVIGGDGTVHEVLQGLRQHLQMPQCLHMPICHVPAGSGNGIAASMGLFTDEAAIHALIKGHVRAIDAVSVQQQSETKPLLAVLSVQYGLLTDLDIGTEHLRKILGGERFTYGAVKEILKWKKHRARVAYCTTEARTVGTSRGMGGTLTCPMLEAVTNSGCSLEQPDRWPPGWHVSEMDSIRYFNIAGPDWAALDSKINPWGVLDDGLWELAVDKCKSRLDGLKMVLQTQSGEHKNSPMFSMVRAGAFIIEPIGDTTYLTVDGEKVNVERLSIEVHRKLLSFVCTADS